MLTPKQRDLLEMIHRRIQTDGVTPSYDEMRTELRLKSKSGIHRLISALEERGYIRRIAHKARALEIIRLPDALDQRRFQPRIIEGGAARPPPPSAMPVSATHALDIPVMGRIAAGTPIEAIQEVSHHVSVPGTMLENAGKHFALEVKGDSMIDAGIIEGDIAVIRQQHDAENGDIVVALVDGEEATLKRLQKRGNSVLALEAANKAYETRIYTKEQVRIQGRLVGLIRSY
ncbi:MAG: transcriptional repressor LexA [Paracoccaceae bacterium]|nr:transcriptional repressor LexA [Paracoccaceae bacterium]MDE2914388.1 transcriptional repressor LexA [Paracoccaceae bacterium]